MSLLLLCGLCLTTSCRQKPGSIVSSSPDSNAIAIVEGNVIGAEAYRIRLKERVARTGVQPSEEDKDALLQEMIQFEAVYARARAIRFDERPEIAASIKRLVVSRFIEQEMGTREPVATNEEIHDYYRNHTQEYVTPEAARGAIIFLRAGPRMSVEKRELVRRKAVGVLAEALQTSDNTLFTRLAQIHSEDQATRYHGGDLGWLTREQCETAFGSELATSLFALKEANELAPMLETSEGFYVLRLLERKEPHTRPLPEVESLIRYQLGRRRQFELEKAFFARMQEGLAVQINRPLLESISNRPADSNPPLLPGSETRKGS